MVSFSKNERGFRLASTAIILLPIACLIFSVSRSQILNLYVFFFYCCVAAAGLIAYLCERAEEEEKKD